MYQELLQCAEIALNDCCSLKRSEKLLIICDPQNIDIGKAFFSAAENRCQETVLIMVTPVNRPGRAEFSESVIEMLRNFNVAIIPLSQSISHFQSKRIASECGIRVVSFPEIDSEIFVRTMKTDWRKIGVYTRKVAGRLSTARKIRVINHAGSDFTFETDGSQVSIDDGRLSTDGCFGILPAGQVSLVVKDQSVEGVVVIDGSVSHMHGKLDKPLVLTMQGGFVKHVEDHFLAQDIEKYFSKNKENRSVSYFGIGTLDTALISGNYTEDKVSRGAIHLVFGKNQSCSDLTGIPSVLEVIISCSTLFVDDKLLLQDGILVNP